MILTELMLFAQIDEQLFRQLQIDKSKFTPSRPPSANVQAQTIDTWMVPHRSLDWQEYKAIQYNKSANLDKKMSSGRVGYRNKPKCSE
jgi:hypothetical protein